MYSESLRQPIALAGQNIHHTPPPPLPSTQVAHKGVCTEEEEKKAVRDNTKSATTGTAAATPTESSAPVAAAMSALPAPATDCAAVTCAPRQKCEPGRLLIVVLSYMVKGTLAEN